MSENPPRSSMQSSIYSDQRMARAKSILEKNLNKSRGAEVRYYTCIEMERLSKLV
jgi:hypothetical protein